MKVRVLIVVLMLNGASNAFAEHGWTTPDGHAVPETESCRAVGGFCGQLIATPDDWKAKWATPTANVPRFNERKIVARGERLSILTTICGGSPSRSRRRSS